MSDLGSFRPCLLSLDPPTLVREWQFWRLWGLPGVIPGVGMG